MSLMVGLVDGYLISINNDYRGGWMRKLFVNQPVFVVVMQFPQIVNGDVHLLATGSALQSLHSLPSNECSDTWKDALHKSPILHKNKYVN